MEMERGPNAYYGRSEGGKGTGAKCVVRIRTVGVGSPQRNLFRVLDQCAYSSSDDEHGIPRYGDSDGGEQAVQGKREHKDFQSTLDLEWVITMAGVSTRYFIRVKTEYLL